MPRAIWKGSISFGLVNIPVELQTAVRDTRPRFHMLHVKDKSPIKFQRVCERDGTPVAWDDLVKGYEYEKGQFIVLTKDDFATAALAKSRSIDILDFVDATEIDDRYFETPYYVVPSAGAERSYALLREALRKTNKAGIAKFILRTTQHLTAVQVVGDAIVLTTMRFADELADVNAFSFPPAASAPERELDLAVRLVDGLSAGWDPARYKDDYQENLMRIIKARLKGKQPVLQEETHPQHAEVVDLMARLRQSLEEAESGKGAAKKSASTRSRLAAPSRKRASGTAAKKRSKTAA